MHNHVSSHPPARQESPSAPIVEDTNKRENDGATEEVSSKHARRVPDATTSAPDTLEPLAASPGNPPPFYLGPETGDFGAAACQSPAGMPNHSPDSSPRLPRAATAQTQ